MRLLHEIAIFQTLKSKVIISLFETVRLSVSISLRNLYNSLNSIKERVFSFQNNPKDLDSSYKMDLDLWHTCQVLGKSKSEIARAPLIFAYNLVIERAEKSGAQVLRVSFFSLFKQT